MCGPGNSGICFFEWGLLKLRMTVDEFREAMNGNIPERFTNPELWNN